MFEEEMDNRTYKLFISQYKEEEEENILFINRLEQAHDFQWENNSLPQDTPLEIKNKLKEADVVVVLSGLYSNHPDYIKKLINTAQQEDKPLVIIRPYGVENIPLELEKKAQEVVGWNAPCIVDAIKGVLGVGEGSCDL
ncbi:TIR domain-containing protein [Methanobacterium alkalithermotolerans]|uniref:TIR domain-containing protein n=1 Tax=Methanobacterium alkalithermotolerans TaxID=2731220 RepID=A0A8T8K5A0_9EURY|nr:TIR domain-containing protein [Methanobacterium alkalithermotolerans]QUH22310.1 TIR domain-containing protein [Methanobacterium alkalithermotolerans]